MLGLSKTTGYAVLALSYLEEPGNRPVVAKTIAQSTDIPLPYLSRILHSLGQRELIETKRGYRGGFCLAKPAKQITLLEIVEAVEGPDWIADCLLGLDCCRAPWACPTYEFWQVERERIKTELGRVTLAQVALYTRRFDERMAISSGIGEGI